MSTAVLQTEKLSVFEQFAQEKPETRPDIALTQTMLGALNAQALYVAAKLGVADSLAAGPKKIDQLAKEVAADESALYRILRALASLGIFAEESDRTFRLTPTASLLRSDVEGSMRPLQSSWVKIGIGMYGDRPCRV